MRSQDDPISPAGILQQRQNQEKMYQGIVGAKGVKPERHREEEEAARGEDRNHEGAGASPVKGHHAPSHCEGLIPHQRLSPDQKTLV